MKYSTLIFLGLLITQYCGAQSSIGATGLDLVNGQGSVSYSVAQTAYKPVESNSNNVSILQGVQVPYEHFIEYCPADINQDGLVNVLDFLDLNSAFGINCSDCREDIDRDSLVNVVDFLDLNSAFGDTCTSSP